MLKSNELYPPKISYNCYHTKGLLVGETKFSSTLSKDICYSLLLGKEEQGLPLREQTIGPNPHPAHPVLLGSQPLPTALCSLGESFAPRNASESS